MKQVNCIPQKIRNNLWKVVYLVLLVWAIAVLMPIYWMFVTSLRPQSGLFSHDLIPDTVTLKNYADMFKMAPVLRWFVNSVIVSVTVTGVALLFDSLAGYVFAILRPKGSTLLFALILSCMMVPDQTRLVPVFSMITDWGWYNTYFALILPFMGSAFGVFLMRQYMSGIPEELVEAARLDGCNEWATYTKVIAPLSKPVFATTAIFFFVGNWNGILWPLTLTSSVEMRTMPVGISTLQGQFQTHYGIMMAGASLTALPVIILFLFLQKYFIRGITIGAVKG